jgi:hypothetical protein
MVFTLTTQLLAPLSLYGMLSMCGITFNIMLSQRSFALNQSCGNDFGAPESIIIYLNFEYLGQPKKYIVLQALGTIRICFMQKQNKSNAYVKYL